MNELHGRSNAVLEPLPPGEGTTLAAGWLGRVLGFALVAVIAGLIRY